MGGARQPKPRAKRVKKQVTVPWKRRVIAKLKENERTGTPPANPEQLRKLIGASKKSLNRLFDLGLDPPQLTSDRVDDINRLLGVAPPLLETEEDDDDLAEVIYVMRTLTRESRRSLLTIAAQMHKK